MLLMKFVSETSFEAEYNRAKKERIGKELAKKSLKTI